MDDSSDTDDDKTVTKNDDTIVNWQLLPNHGNGNEVESNLNHNENTNLTEELKSLDLFDTTVTRQLLQIDEPNVNVNEHSTNKNNSYGTDNLIELSITTNNDIETEEEVFINVEQYRHPLSRINWEPSSSNTSPVTDNRNTNPRSIGNVSITPTQFLNNLASLDTWTIPNHEEVINEPRQNLVQFPNDEINYDLELLQNYNRNNIPRAFNYNIEEDIVLNREPDTRIYLPDLHIYHNASLNALANENVLMDQLYHANRGLNIQHNQNIVRQNNIGVAENIPLLPNNLHQNPILHHLFRQNQRQQFPLDHLILVANGGINPMNGGHNGMIRFLENNPNLLFLNIRNVIILVHPSILDRNNNVLFEGNQWIPARELLLQNNGLDDLLTGDPINEEFNQEDGPASARSENAEERNR